MEEFAMQNPVREIVQTYRSGKYTYGGYKLFYGVDAIGGTFYSAFGASTDKILQLVPGEFTYTLHQGDKWTYETQNFYTDHNRGKDAYYYSKGYWNFYTTNLANIYVDFYPTESRLYSWWKYNGSSSDFDRYASANIYFHYFTAISGYSVYHRPITQYYYNVYHQPITNYYYTVYHKPIDQYYYNIYNVLTYSYYNQQHSESTTGNYYAYKYA